MADLLVIWLALLAALTVFVLLRRKAGALTLAYFLGLSLIHVPGVLAYINPHFGVVGHEETEIGFKVTLIGLTAFVVGAMAACVIARLWAPAQAPAPQVQSKTLDDLGWRALVGGVIAYFVLLPIAGQLPSLTSLVSAFPTLLILGLWLRLYGAALSGDARRTFETYALLPLLPLSTLVTGGFIGFGVYWVLSIVAFQFMIARRRLWFFLAAPLVIFLGLSLFVTYMGQRTGIRDVVWQERAGLTDRLERTATLVTKFELLDLQNPVHFAALNGRLNQNYLVGAGVIRHRAGQVGLSYGSTIEPWALIPRAIWPNKPVVGGGRDVVTRFTGIRFAEGTSVGAGQVLEFYMNFGMAGVVVGFLALGFGLMRLDQVIMGALARGDMRRFILYGMPGLCLLQPGGNLLEILVAVVAAIIAAHLILSIQFFRAATGAPPPRKRPKLGRAASAAPRT